MSNRKFNPLPNGSECSMVGKEQATAKEGPRGSSTGTVAPRTRKQSIDQAEPADDEAIARLAELPPLEYERQRKAEAKRLGVRESALDREVEKRKPRLENASLQGRPVELPAVEAWPQPVDGAATLSAVADAFLRYTALPDGTADALALWCAHTHVFAVFRHSPRLNISSPEKRCGKTTLRDVVTQFVQRPVPTENMSVAVLFRLVDAHAPTLLIDECDAWLRDNDELRGLLNAGHKRGAEVHRIEGEAREVRAFGAYAPAALCGIGALPGTLQDRSIVVRLARAKPGEVRARFDDRKADHERELCRKLARWGADHSALLQECDPALPDGVFNRLADNWRPLFAIAQIAGGDWPERAPRACRLLTAEGDGDEQSISAMLLADVQQILTGTACDPISSEELVEELVKMEGRPWSEFGKAERPITATKVSRLLRKFEIVSATKRRGSETFKGYHHAQFSEAFARYLEPQNVTASHTA